jgi:hypothetical protein
MQYIAAIGLGEARYQGFWGHPDAVVVVLRQAQCSSSPSLHGENARHRGPPIISLREPVPQARTSSKEDLPGSCPVASEIPVASSDHRRIDGGRRRRVEGVSRLDITSPAGLLTSYLRSKSLLFAGRVPSGHPPGRLMVIEDSDGGG